MEERRSGLSTTQSMLSPRTMSIISSVVAWAERILQHVDGVFQPTIGTLLISSNQDLMHLRTISRLLECQSASAMILVQPHFPAVTR